MKKQFLARSLAGGALLLILAVPIVAQPGERGPRDGRGPNNGDGPRRGPRAKG